MKTKVTYIISNIDKALAFEWINENINKSKFEINFILLNPDSSYLEKYLIENKIEVKFIQYRGKKSLLSAFFKMMFYLLFNRPKVVHCHLFEASLIGLFVSKILFIKKRIYTRHHSSFMHIYYPKSVKYDRFINFLATDIVAISKNVENILIQKENVNPNKITLIHHGFKLENFANPNKNNIEELRIKYQTSDFYPVIGVIARYTHWKGIQYIIQAFKKLLETYPKAHLILANASGEYKSIIQNLLKELPETSYTEIKFEKDLYNFYQLFNVYIHTPIDHHSEAFGQTYVEALAAGIPSVFTLSGIASDFIKDKHNAIVVPYKSEDDIYAAVLELLNNEDLRSKIIQNGKNDVNRLFKLSNMIESFEKLYVKN